jgi:hypothetical protein
LAKLNHYDKDLVQKLSNSACDLECKAKEISNVLKVLAIFNHYDKPSFARFGYLAMRLATDFSPTEAAETLNTLKKFNHYDKYWLKWQQLRREQPVP